MALVGWRRVAGESGQALMEPGPCVRLVQHSMVVNFASDEIVRTGTQNREFPRSLDKCTLPNMSLDLDSPVFPSREAGRPSKRWDESFFQNPFIRTMDHGSEAKSKMVLPCGSVQSFFAAMRAFLWLQAPVLYELVVTLET